jgi:MFS superfamily sulfate permease-like transporter
MTLKYIKQDAPASVVVFLVALPLCLGIALASGAPLYSGILSGVIGGILVGFISGSQLSISGPAAGLTIIVARSIDSLGSYDIFLLAVIVAGLIQVFLGYIKAGVLSSFFPHSVIKGMLAAIGIILILKQIPHALGFDSNYVGEESFFQFDGQNSVLEIFSYFQYFTIPAVIVSIVSLGILLLWDSSYFKRFKIANIIPGVLIAVIWGILYNVITASYYPSLAMSQNYLVTLPSFQGLEDAIHNLAYPDFSQWMNPLVYKVAFTVALLASIEALLSLEAIYKLDPEKRITPRNRELVAQGCGNILCGLVGGIPLTSVIVRSSININSGAKTKLSSMLHGFFLFTAVIFLSDLINLIPLACLAVFLIQVGYKLTKPEVFKTAYKNGLNQFIPFIATIIAILLTDLLIGIFIGVMVGFIFVLRSNYRESISLTQHNQNYLLRFNKDIFFINKPQLRKNLELIPDNASVLIDATRANFIDHDVLESIKDFIESSTVRNIDIEIRKTHNARYALFCKNENE